jgi:hypothetical protein
VLISKNISTPPDLLQDCPQLAASFPAAKVSSFTGIFLPSLSSLFIRRSWAKEYVSAATEMTTTELASREADAFDYLIVGGGTAGCVIASRLAEYLPHKRILLIEAGPSDYLNDKVLNLKDWLNLLGGELDYDYGTTDQPNGK